MLPRPMRIMAMRASWVELAPLKASGPVGSERSVGLSGAGVAVRVEGGAVTVIVTTRVVHIDGVPSSQSSTVTL